MREISQRWVIERTNANGRWVRSMANKNGEGGQTIEESLTLLNAWTTTQGLGPTFHKRLTYRIRSLDSEDLIMGDVLWNTSPYIDSTDASRCKLCGHTELRHEPQAAYGHRAAWRWLLSLAYCVDCNGKCTYTPQSRVFKRLFI